MTVAQAHIELAARLAERHGRPPRWLGAPSTDAPAACAYFLISAASARWVDAAAAHPRIRAVDVSIEGMAVFAAIEASRATGRVQVVIAGAGPGTLGMLWAVPAAKAQGASVLVLVPRTPPHLAGCVDIQESSWRHPLHTAGSQLYDELILMEDVAEMPRVALRLRHLFARPQGAIVALCAPTSLLERECPPLPDVDAVEIALPAPGAGTVERVAALLTAPGGPPAFMLGSACLPYRDALGAMLERWDAVHFTSPAAAALIPGSLGVIGNGAYGDVPVELRRLGPSCIVILGSRLGTASGGGSHALFPEGCPIVQVDVDPDATANAMATRSRPVLSINADLGEFLDALARIDPEPRTRPLDATAAV